MSMAILKGLHRRALGISNRDQVMARSGFVAGGEDKPAIVLPGNPDTVAIFDDFLGDVVRDEWTFVQGDTGIPTGAIVTGTNGVYRMTGSETQGVSPAECMALTTGTFKQWKADMGAGSMKSDRALRMSARIKMASISRVAEGGRNYVFVGLADTGGAEMPVYDTGAGFISNASDLVGFAFGPAGDTGWTCVACRADTDQSVVAGASYGPVANTYTTLELEVRSGLSDTGGTAHFWIDGKKVGTIGAPVTSTVAMSPWIGCFSTDTGFAPTLDIDYVAISGSRDTGL